MNVKTRKRILSIILLTVCLALLAACGSDEIYGVWKAECNVSNMLLDQVEDDEMMQYFDFSNLPLVLTLEFTEENTYRLGTDGDSVEAFREELTEVLENGIYNYIEAMLDQENIDMTLEELMETGKITEDDISILLNEMLDEVIWSLSLDDAIEGRFIYQDGKLYLSYGLNNEIDMNIMRRVQWGSFIGCWKRRSWMMASARIWNGHKWFWRRR